MPATDPHLVEVHEQRTAVVRGRVPTAELAAFFDRSFGALAAALARQGVPPMGPAFARYDGPPGDVAELEVGFPVAAEIDPDGDVVPSSLPAGTAATLEHRGPYDDLGTSWARLVEWADAEGHERGSVLWETYVTEPSPDADPADMVTELTWLLR